jgi:hypothetical protein
MSSALADSFPLMLLGGEAGRLRISSTSRACSDELYKRCPVAIS